MIPLPHRKCPDRNEPRYFGHDLHEWVILLTFIAYLPRQTGVPDASAMTLDPAARTCRYRIPRICNDTVFYLYVRDRPSFVGSGLIHLCQVSEQFSSS